MPFGTEGRDERLLSPVDGRRWDGRADSSGVKGFYMIGTVDEASAGADADKAG